MMPFGASFLPAPPSRDAAGGAPNARGGLEEAIRLLSVRVPSLSAGMPSLAPEALLNAPGLAGIADAPGGWEAFLRRLLVGGPIHPPTASLVQSLGPMLAALAGSGQSARPLLAPLQAPPRIVPGFRPPDNGPVETAPLAAPALPPPRPPGIRGLPGIRTD